MYDNERDKDLLQAPYKRIAAAEEQLNSNALLDLYVSLYKKKYKEIPIFPTTREHINMMNTFSRQTGPKAYGMLEHYFSMKDDWFAKQNHSLSCLLNNINKVNVSYSQKVHHVKETQGKMSVAVFCDHCWKDMVISVTPGHDFDKTNRCEECEKNGTPPKRVSKADIRKTIGILGAAFPDMPE